MKKLFILLFLSFNVFCFSQKIDKQNAKFTIRGNIGIPRTISSSMFAKSFNGVYEGNLSFNARIFSNFFVGLGYQYSNFFNREEVFVFYRATNGALSYATRLIANAPYIKIGYDYFFSEKGYVAYSLNTGLMLNSYKSVNPDTSISNAPFPSSKFSCPYVQPEISANFIVEDHLSFSFFINYNTMFYKFDPKAPRFNQVEEVKIRGNKYFISYFTFGFGFNILLNGKKSASATE